MPDGTNNQPDEYEGRSNDGHKRRPDDGQTDDQLAQTPLPLLTRDDLTPEEAAELDTWQTAWERGTVSDEEFARVIQRIYTQACARFGIQAVTLEEAMQAVQRLRAYLRQQRDNDEG